VNCEAEASLCNRYGVQGYPTILLVTKSGDIETFGNAEHTADAIYGWVEQTLKNNVFPLTTKNFAVTNNGSLWIVDFSAGTWCGPCTTLKATLRRVAAELQGIANVGMVECDREPICGQTGVTYYPQVRLFMKDRLPATGQLLEVNQNFPAAGMLDVVATLTKLLLPRPQDGTPEPHVETEPEPPAETERSSEEGHTDL